MSKVSKRYNLEAILQKKEEVTGGRDVEFSWAGKHYSFPHPSFASDDWTEALQSAEGARGNGVAVLGQEQYEKFHTDGGEASFLSLLIEEVTKKEQDVKPDGTPTASSTS